MNPIQAIQNRDPEALDQAFSSLEAAKAFRSDVLPMLSPDDCRWFWQQVMTPEQFASTFEAMREVVLAVAKSQRTFPGQVQGGYLEDVPVVYATDSARALIFAELPADRHSFLNALLIPFPLSFAEELNLVDQ